MITLLPKSTLLRRGESLTLEAYSKGEDTIKFQSTNPNIAKVSPEGEVEAVGTGVAYITAYTTGKVKDSATTRVDVAGFQVNQKPENPIELKLGKCSIISILRKHPLESYIVASSSDEEVVRIYEAGATSYRLKALSEGKATVKLELYSSEEEVEEGAVKRPLDSIEFEVEVGNIVSIDFKEKTLEVELVPDEVLGLEVVTDPSDAKVTYLSSNPEVIAIEDNEPVLKGLGKAVIVARKYDESDRCTVTVKGIQLSLNGTVSVGHSALLEVTSSEKKVPSFESSDETIAIVDRYGFITGIKPGECFITATVGDSSRIYNLKVVEFFTPKEVLTPEDLKAINIFCHASEIKSFAKGREIICRELPDGTPLYYIKSNSDPNTFEYELAILTVDLARYNALKCQCSAEEGSSSEEAGDTPSNENSDSASEDGKL